MGIVFFMASIAIGRRLVLVQRARMTAAALRFPVVAFQPVAGIAIVGKQQGFPIPFGVATLAFLVELSLVLVVFLVARVAIVWGLVLIKRPLMAGFALGRDMPSPDRVLGV